MKQRFMANEDISELLVISKKGRIKHAVGQAYEWFLELPVPIVLAAMWLAGAALMGLCGAALYASWLALQAVAGG